MQIQGDKDSEPVPGYRLVRFIGSGGYGEVWEARAPGDVPVALKFIRLGTRQAETELRALGVIRNIRHPHLLDVQFVLQVENKLVVGMPLCDRNLWDRFHECRVEGLRGIPRDELLRYMGESALALDFLNEARHKADDGRLIGVQHRDVKPQNLFLVGDCVRVADFGLAKILESHSITNSTSMTPAYVAPEVLQGMRSPRSDQYSLAVTYCELLCGTLPFSGSYEELLLGHVQREPDLAGLPDEDRPIVGRALAKRPEDRWATCQEFVAHLTQHTPAWVAERTSVFQETLVRSPDSPALAGPAQQTTAPFVDTHGQTPESTPVTLRRDDATTSQVETGGRRFNAPWVGAGVLSITAVVLAMIYFPRGTTNAPQKPSGIPSVEPSKKNHAAVNPSPGGSKSDQSGGAARNNLVIDQTTPAKTANSNEAISIDPIPSFTKLPDGGIEVALNSSGTAMRFVRVPSGEFEMGSRDDDKEAGDDERPQHLVRIRRAFYLGAHEVTRCEFRAFVQATNYTTEAESDGSGGGGFDTGTGGIAVRNARFSWQNVGWPSTERHPVVNVTWDDAKRFCQWLAMRVGRPCRLPTEAEWEYACRAGTTTRYSFGDNEADLATHANVLDGGAAKQLKLGPANLADDRFRFAAPCAEFPANESPAMNAFKLFDMHGNVAEWCEDGYDAKYYQKRIVDDPLCQPIGDARVLRGGSWGMPASYARSAARLMFMRDGRNDDVGFRVVIEATDE